MLSKLSIEELNEFLDDLFDRLKNEAKLYNSQSEFDIFLTRYQFQKNDDYKGNLYNDNAKVLILGVNLRKLYSIYRYIYWSCSS